TALTMGGLATAGAAPHLARSRAGRYQDGGAGIIIGTLGEAQTINPFLTNESEGDWRCKMLFDELVHINPATYAPEPGIAASWEIVDQTFTFTLQPNAAFSDGADLTAADVAFTIKGHLAKDTASPRQQKYLSIDGAQAYADGTAPDVTGIEVVDPKTLKITLGTPDAAFLFNLRFIFVVPAAQLEGKSLTDDAWFQAPVGAGPFAFESWQVGGDFVATKNESYWQTGKPALTGFTHRTIADANSLVLALQSGEIDASNYPAPTLKAELEQNPDLAILVPPFTSPNGWMFNVENQYLADVRVRRAIAMALDTTRFADDFLLGLGKPGNGPIAPDSWAYDPNLQPIPYDVEGAKALLAEAGFQAGTELRFLVNSGNVLREDWLAYSQQALEEVGITVVPEAIEYATLTDRVTTSQDYHACGVDFAGVTAEPSELFDQFHSGSPGNYMNYSNPELDALLEQAKQELDIEVAKGLYAQIQALIVTDVPMFYAWYRPFLHVVKKTYTGYTDSAAYGLFHTLEDWTVTP
ncbi:MAG: ABC transporter substrate-binding protein, partial [Chloroflexota bacterium]|nr:ABC transporter substrate-binding protein [Chloroflexota bacterium]